MYIDGDFVDTVTANKIWWPPTMTSKHFIVKCKICSKPLTPTNCKSYKGDQMCHFPCYEKLHNAKREVPTIDPMYFSNVCVFTETERYFKI